MYVCCYICFSYQLLLLKPSTKALSQASKVCIRTDSRGFLSLQYMIRIEDGQICFVEYLVSACVFKYTVGSEEYICDRIHKKVPFHTH